MLTVSELSQISLTDIKSLGHNGYVSDQLYKVTTESRGSSYSFSIDVELLVKPYSKYGLAVRRI